MFIRPLIIVSFVLIIFFLFCLLTYSESPMFIRPFDLSSITDRSKAILLL